MLWGYFISSDPLIFACYFQNGSEALMTLDDQANKLKLVCLGCSCDPLNTGFYLLQMLLMLDLC